MSNICSSEAFIEFLDEINMRYQRSKNGYEYDFKQEIEPFLLKSKQLSKCIESSEVDHRFTETIKNKVMSTTTELAMSCHISRFSKKIFNEMYKYISHWFFYINERDL